MLEWVKSALERTEVKYTNFLCREDDGGPVFEADQPLPQAAEINTPLPMDAVG